MPSVLLFAQLLFVLLFALVVIDFVRTPDRVGRDVVLMFFSLAGVILIEVVVAVLPGLRWLDGVSAMLLLAQPYLALRLAADVRAVPRRWRLLALAGLIGGWLLMLGTAAFASLRPVLLLNAGYFVAVESAAAVIFLRQARAAVGASRARLLLAAVATAGLLLDLFGTLLLGVLHLTATASGVTQGASLFVAVTYFLAFAPPAWLRRAWRLPELLDFIEQANPVNSDAPEQQTWRRLTKGAERVVSGRSAAVLLRQADGSLVAALDFEVFQDGVDSRLAGELSGAWNRPTGIILPQSADAPASSALAARVGAHSVLAFPIRGQTSPLGLLVVFLDGAALFAGDDLDLLALLVKQAAREIEAVRQLEEHTRQLEVRNRQLEVATTELRLASQAKSEFVANMSHELRTPLNSVIGFSELMLMSPEMAADGERRTRYLNNIFNSGKHLLTLINDVLDLAKVEAGQMQLRLINVDVAAMSRSVLETVQPMASAKHIELHAELGDAHPIRLDEARLRQILLNLLSNAIKFTPDGGRVSLTLEWDDDLTICVADSGIGIKPEDQARIFEEFQQVESGATRHEQGTGLGLALTRRLAQLHGGRVWVESELDRGSRFFVSLPREVTEAQPVRSAAAAAGNQPLVMIVEDHPEAALLLEATLAGAGYATTVVSDAGRVVASARALKPAAITLDILLPEPLGWTLLQELKAIPETRDIPVIVISVVDDTLSGLALGAADYLLKPVAHDRLLSSIGRLVPHQRGSARPRLLAVDDDPAELERLTASLGGIFDVQTASNGFQALQVVRERAPDIVVLDLLMPGMDGLEVAEELRARPDTQSVPILLLTAKSLSNDERQTLSRTVNHIAQKGAISGSQLVAQLKRVAGGKEGRRSA